MDDSEVALLRKALQRATALGGTLAYMDKVNTQVRVIDKLDGNSAHFKETNSWLLFRSAELSNFRLILPVSPLTC